MSVTRNVMRNAVVGALVSVWGVARHQGTRVDDDLHLNNCELFVIDEIADMPGFGSAMEAAGWCLVSTQGLVFPKFFKEHNTDPKDAKREKDRLRQQRHRDSKQGRDKPVTVTRDCHADVTHRERERERVESNTPNPLSGGRKQRKPPFTIDDVKFPDGMDSPDVRNAVADWLQHKRSLGKGYKTTSSVHRLIEQWLMNGPAAFVEAIHHSIGQNYQGVYSPGGGNGTGNNQRDHGAARESSEELRQRKNLEAIAGFMSKGGLHEGDAGPRRLEADGDVHG